MTDLREDKPRDSIQARLCADALRALGWSSADTEKILAGPRQSSIHDIAGRPVAAWSVDTLEAFAVADPAGRSAPSLVEEEPLTDIGLEQKDLADAVWASVAVGDPIPLAAIALKLKRLSGPLQAYLLACSWEVKRYYNDLASWKRDFDRAQRDSDDQRGKARKDGAALASGAAAVVAAVASAAAVANAVPVVGQVVSAVLVLGLAIGTAITQAYALPVRKAVDQIRPGYEGTRVFFGFAVEAPESPYEDPYRKLKQAVVQDAVAFRLPVVRPRTRFDFAPRLSAFQAAANELGLYPEDENPHD